MSPRNTEWPAHKGVKQPWKQTVRGGRREDRMLTSVTASIPPTIAERGVDPSSSVAAAVDEATTRIVALDRDSAGVYAGVAAFLLRTESVASSKIEHIETTPVDFAKAMIGATSSRSANAVFEAVQATTALIEDCGADGISADALLGAHNILMRNDRLDADYAGRYRDMQNWIGGSDYSPRNALYVPPPPDRVEPLMSDLFTFANRTDMPAIVQAAIAHAQFESIHPFTDGNGRIGRALINAVLRRRRATTQVAVPIAVGMLARTEQYFAALTAYRSGDLDTLLTFVAQAATRSCVAALESVDDLVTLAAEWPERVRPRKGSTAQRLVPLLAANPVLTVEHVKKLCATNAESASAAIETLVEADVIREITGRKRDRIWVVHEVLEELDRLIERVAS